MGKDKKNKTDLAPMTFPKVTPEKHVRDYLTSKMLGKLIVKFPQWDLAQASPSMELVTARRALAIAEDILTEKRKEAREKRKEMDEQWKSLEEKEATLKQSFTKFNTFVRENQEKRERAEKKIQDAINLQKLRESDIAEIKGNIAKMLKDKAEMEQYIKEYKLYETYLTSVVKCSDFKTVNDILVRYEALVEAKKELSEKQDRDLNALESARNDMLKLIEEKTLQLMGLNNQVADLQGRFEIAGSKALEWETTVTKIKTLTADKVAEIDSVKVCCWNMYLQMCKRKQMTPEIAQEDIESQLMFIKKTLNELKSVIKKAKKKESLSTIKGTKGSNRKLAP